jgi:hypothetical protein
MFCLEKEFLNNIAAALVLPNWILPFVIFGALFYYRQTIFRQGGADP